MKPCVGTIECYLSRPQEKNIFLWYMYGSDFVSIGLTIFELFQGETFTAFLSSLSEILRPTTTRNQSHAKSLPKTKRRQVSVIKPGLNLIISRFEEGMITPRKLETLLVNGLGLITIQSWTWKLMKTLPMIRLLNFLDLSLCYLVPKLALSEKMSRKIYLVDSGAKTRLEEVKDHLERVEADFDWLKIEEHTIQTQIPDKKAYYVMESFSGPFYEKLLAEKCKVFGCGAIISALALKLCLVSKQVPKKLYEFGGLASLSGISYVQAFIVSLLRTVMNSKTRL